MESHYTIIGMQVLIIVQNIHSTLKTSNKKLKSILHKKYRQRVEGYSYSPAYKKGHWDGFKSFFSEKTGKFGTGMLQHVLDDLGIADLPYTIDDQRTQIENKDFGLSGIELRPYQKELTVKALELKNCIIKAPTGSGKTVVLASILQALKGRTGLIFFTKKQLLYQTYTFLTSHGFDVGVAFGDGVDIKPLTLCTIQSIDKVIDSHLKTSEFIIFDEVHEFSKGKIASKAIESFPNARVRIGMTATIPKNKLDRLTLISALGQVIEGATATDLIESGFLTEPVIQIVTVPDCVDCIDDTVYREIYRKCITENETRNDMIRDLVVKIKQNPCKVLILTKDLEHAKILNDSLPGSLKLEGKDDLLTRSKTIKEFTDQEHGVLIGTTIMQTGVDIPEITHFINARGLKSEIATIQAMGRALRIHKSKIKVYIYDFLDNAPYLTTHAKQRIKSYEALNFKVYIDGKERR